MLAITFLIAIAALVLAILAYQRTGGSRRDLEKQLDTLRQKTADTLAKVEKSLRKEE